MKLLIVENSREISERLRRLLAAEKALRIECSDNMRKGLDRMRQYRPDALVIDVRLPDGNGIELMRLAKQELPAARIIMLTNLTHLREYCLKEGADEFLDKSMDFELLVGLIHGIGDDIRAAELRRPAGQRNHALASR